MNMFESSPTPAAPGARATTPFRLVFPHGVANLTIRADPSMSGNYRGEFYGPKPRVTEADGVVAIDYSQFNPFVWGRTSADVRLSPSVRWVIEIRGGVSHWDGDLRDLDLAGIEVRGGVNKVDLRLASPSETVLVRVSGGVNRLTLRRPGTVPARVQIGGGASKLELDSQYLGAIGGPVRLETPDYSNAAGRYELEVGGGASRITIRPD
jgi:hypothetical protein